MARTDAGPRRMKTSSSLFNDLRDNSEELAASLDAIGYSVTLERSLKEDKHVHGHAYFHLRKAFHRKGSDALQCLIFDGKSPHVKPNTARIPERFPFSWFGNLDSGQCCL
jgi:hypothetical protein